VVELHRLAGFQGPSQLGRAGRLDPDDPDGRLESSHRRGNSGYKPAATHRHQDVFHRGQRFKDLQPAGPLARDHVEALVGRYHCETSLLRQRPCPFIPYSRSVAGDYDLTAESLDCFNLDRGGTLGHDHHGGNAEQSCRIGNRLSMVTAGIRDDTTCPARDGQPGDGSVGPPDLEGTNGL
jgi:hypothetical protein